MGAFDRAQAVARTIDDPDLRVSALTTLVQSLATRGELRRARALCLDLVLQSSAAPPVVASVDLEAVRRAAPMLLDCALRFWAQRPAGRGG